MFANNIDGELYRDLQSTSDRGGGGRRRGTNCPRGSNTQFAMQASSVQVRRTTHLTIHRLRSVHRFRLQGGECKTIRMHRRSSGHCGNYALGGWLG